MLGSQHGSLSILRKRQNVAFSVFCKHLFIHRITEAMCGCELYRPSKMRYWALEDLRMKKKMMVRRATRMQLNLKKRSRSSKRCRSRFSACSTLPCFKAALQQNGLLYTVHATHALLKVLRCPNLDAILETCSTSCSQELLHTPRPPVHDPEY